MKIITNKQYDLICEIVMEAKMKAEMLEADNKELQKEIEELKDYIEILKKFSGFNTITGLNRAVLKQYINSVYGSSNTDIDFPNSSKETNVSDDKLI